MNPKPRILVLWYSQTGQLKEILQGILSEVRDAVEVTWAEIHPVEPFPFPWTPAVFFDAMPECVLQLPRPVKPLPAEFHQQAFDLVVFGYQPWFLHPSQPALGFLHSDDAALLKDKPVVTVIGCRNMWLNAQECVKAQLARHGARLVGNIVLRDKNPNLISTLTVLRWAFKGQKAAGRFLPEAGVQAASIAAASRFGGPLARHLQGGTLGALHEEWLKLGSVELNPSLVILEQRGLRGFRVWAPYIRGKGGPGAPGRASRIRQFRVVLLLGILVLSPLSALTALIRRRTQRRQLQEQVDYFRELWYEAGKM